MARRPSEDDENKLLALLGRRIGDARLLALLQSLIRHGGEPAGKGMPIVLR